MEKEEEGKKVEERPMVSTKKGVIDDETI